jgi:hypothetical protein
MPHHVDTGKAAQSRYRLRDALRERAQPAVST